jgi:uncharacterized RDD family membrane protein YckC
VNTDSENPYAPPLTEIADGGRARDLGAFDDATNSKRFLNLILDQIAIMGLSFVCSFVVALAYEMSGDGADEYVESLDGAGSYLIGYLLTIIYYLLMESAFGLTLGKLITGTRVVSESGQKPTFGALIGRSFARLVPFEPFSFFGGNGGWHDRWSHTRVVDIRNAPVPLASGLRNAYGRRSY